MNAIAVVAALGFVSVGWYLTELFLFATTFRRDDEAIWIQLGRPERLGISGQLRFLKVALGLTPLPPEVASRYRWRFRRIWMLLAIFVPCFVILSIMTSSGSPQ